MKIGSVLLPAALAIGATSSASAAPIQIDFTGIITGVFDFYGSMPGSVAIGDTAIGRVVFDDEALNIFLEQSWHTEYFDQAFYGNHSDWITSSISINGQVYSEHVPDQGNNYDQINIRDGLINSPLSKDAVGVSEQSEFYDSNGNYAYWYSGIRGDGPYNVFHGTDISIFPELENFFQSFDLSMAGFVSGLNYEFGIYGNITSAIVTRREDSSIEVPEPSSVTLFAAGLIGLGLKRRYTFGKSRC